MTAKAARRQADTDRRIVARRERMNARGVAAASAGSSRQREPKPPKPVPVVQYENVESPGIVRLTANTESEANVEGDLPVNAATATDGELSTETGDYSNAGDLVEVEPKPPPVKSTRRWKTYKNRKKTIRRMWMSGKIDTDKRDRLLAAARLRYDADAPSADARYWHECREVGEKYLADGGVVPDPDKLADGSGCDESCIGARGRVCVCPCEGVNHGVAWGMPPESVRWWNKGSRSR